MSETQILDESSRFTWAVYSYSPGKLTQLAITNEFAFSHATW